MWRTCRGCCGGFSASRCGRRVITSERRRMRPDAATVIVAVYNGASTIEACVASLLALHYPRPDHEIIVVDNGSTDGTAAVLASFGDRVRVLTEPTRGASAARNRGIRHARGRVIAFTDADCTVEPGWLAALV